VDKPKPLWTCPKCGKSFVTRNMWHSCGRYTVDQFFEGKSHRARELFGKYVEFVRQIGPFSLSPNKASISFQVRARFAGVQKAGEDHIVAGFWLKRRIESPRFTRVELIPPDNWVYRFIVRDEKDLDGEALSWLKEAYQVGAQSKLKK